LSSRSATDPAEMLIMFFSSLRPPVLGPHLFWFSSCPGGSIPLGFAVHCFHVYWPFSFLLSWSTEQYPFFPPCAWFPESSRLAPFFFPFFSLSVQMRRFPWFFHRNAPFLAGDFAMRGLYPYFVFSCLLIGNCRPEETTPRVFSSVNERF